ncbi:unnamed protein product [Diamesa hyperborea]
MKFIILLCVVLSAVLSQQEPCDEIQDFVVSHLSPIKTYIDDQAVKFEKKINAKLYDAVSSLVTCNGTLSSFLHTFLTTNKVESLNNFTSAWDGTVVSSYDKIMSNFTQDMVAKRSTALNTHLFTSIQDQIKIKTEELKKLIAEKTGNMTCFIEVFKKTFKILTDTFIPNIGDFLIDTKDQKISDVWEKYVITLKKWCDEIQTEVTHCKTTTFTTCCIDAYLAANKKEILMEIDLGTVAVELESFIESIFDQQKLKLVKEINDKFQVITEQLDTCI